MIRLLVFLMSLGLVFISCGGDDEPEAEDVVDDLFSDG